MIWTGTVLTVVVAGAAVAAVVAAPVAALGVVAGVWAAAAASEKIKKQLIIMQYSMLRYTQLPGCFAVGAAC